MFNILLGVFNTCHDCGVEWVVIKGVSDYADDTKSQTANWKSFASAMAASVVSHIFKYPDVLEQWPHYSGSVQNDNYYVEIQFVKEK